MPIFTVGHSNHPIEKFIGLLEQHDIELVVDVRSAPYSKYAHWFNQENLSATLQKNSILYVFKGHQLGGRPNDPISYINGKLDPTKRAESIDFKAGLASVCRLAMSVNVALVCSEKDPAKCHRGWLITPELKKLQFKVEHIIPVCAHN